MSESSPNNGSELVLSNKEKARAQFGAWMRQARENTGVSIEAISQETRINKGYILSLESGELDALPGKVFGRGFIKNITKLLKSDSGECLRLYDACWGTPAAPENSAVAVNANGGVAAEAHKTKSVQARIAEPIDTTSTVARRLITEDFAAAGEKPRVPRINRGKKRALKVALPTWVVRGVVSPHIRLWILASVATVFVMLVFGRWAAGTIHKSRLATNAQKLIATEAVIAAKVSANEVDTERELAMPETEVATPNVAKFDTTATSTVIDPAKPAVHDAMVDKVAVPVTTKALETDEDNSLYIPSTPSAAFEQVLELNVAGNVEVRLTLDGKRVEKSWFEPQTYHYTFNNKAEVYILDASQVDLLYNGKSLGVLGSKGRRRRIVFQAKASQDDFPQ